MRAAFEFRHDSWFDDEIFELLKSRNIALCIADTDDLATPKKITADYGYLRLRREDYKKADVESWAKFVGEQKSNWKDAFVYFKHEESGIGPKLAQQMIELLGLFRQTQGVNEYAPTSRRPIAGIFRRTADAATRFCVRQRIHPDAVSYLSILAAIIAAICFWKSGEIRWLLIVAPPLCYLRLWFNMLDGMVAVAAGKASRRGEILNDLPDRISDVIIFVGVAHSGLMNPFIGYWAAIFAVVTAYV